MESFQLTVGRHFSHQCLALLSHLVDIWNLASTPGLPHQNLYLNLISLAFERTWEVSVGGHSGLFLALCSPSMGSSCT